MDIREYTYFLAIVDCGSVTKAAESLYISQPSLSIFLKKLESRMGFPLFARVGSKLTLTNEGRIYEEYARRITAMNKELEQYFFDLEHLNKGSIQIGLTANRGSLILELLPIIHEKLPNISIKLVEGTSEQLEEQAMMHKLDFVLLNIPFKNYDLDYIPLFEEEVVVGIPKAFGADISNKVHSISNSNYPWIDIAHLKNYPFILSKPGQRLRQISDYLFLAKGITPDVCMETGSIYNIVTSINQQISVGFLLDSYINTYNLTQSDLLFCSVGVESVTKLQYVLAYPKDGYLSAPAQKCIDTLVSIISNTPLGHLSANDNTKKP